MISVVVDGIFGDAKLNPAALHFGSHRTANVVSNTGGLFRGALVQALETTLVVIVVDLIPNDRDVCASEARVDRNRSFDRRLVHPIMMPQALSEFVQDRYPNIYVVMDPSTTLVVEMLTTNALFVRPAVFCFLRSDWVESKALTSMIQRAPVHCDVRAHVPIESVFEAFECPKNVATKHLGFKTVRH